MIAIFTVFLALFYLQPISTLQADQVKVISRGELYTSSTSTSYTIDNISVFNIDTLSISKTNFRATFTGWI